MEAKQTVSLKLYTELSTWWPLLSPPDDYLDEANFVHSVLVAAGLPPAPTLRHDDLRWTGCFQQSRLHGRCRSKKTGIDLIYTK